MNERIKYWVDPNSGQMSALVWTFFDAIRESDFLKTIDQLLKKQNVSVSDGIVVCMFEENYDPADFAAFPEHEFTQPFKGIRISLLISWKDPLEYEILNSETFMRYLRLACMGFRNQNWHKEKVLIETFQVNGLIW